MKSGKRYIIPDIHGCSKTLRALIENKIVPTKEDSLFFLGDYIDRGPDSAGVIDYILYLQNVGYQLKLLKGNHEENILQAHNEYDNRMFVHFVTKINKSNNLLDENGLLLQKYFDFFTKLDYYYELNDCFLVHAGFDFSKPNPFEDYNSMLELRRSDINTSLLGKKKLIVGHQVTYLSEIEHAVCNKSQIIPLDNGCVFTKPHKIIDYTQTGNLCCLNMDKFELIIQKNID